jgi:cytochrome P450
MGEFDGIDFFRGNELVADPYPYYDHLRAQCPVHHEPQHDVVMVTGYDEAVAVFTNTATFSSCNAVTGPFPGFPVPLEGDDVSDLIEQHRDELPFSDQIIVMDPPKHKAHRGLMMRLITPKRLKENEDFMWRHADRQIDEFIERGECEFIRDFAGPFTLYVIADLLGVPEEDHEQFRQGFGYGNTPGVLGDTEGPNMLNALSWCDEMFTKYVEDRRANPRADVLTDLAQAKYPDGTTPEVVNVVRSSTFLFAAGQETTARLLAVALKYLAENPELQDDLRANRELIPDFIEEALRIESPVKADFRMTRRNTSIGGVDVKAGTPVMLLNGAANWDPKRYECPEQFRVGRPGGRSHLAFGRGAHTCPGGPLARAEGRISVEKILDRTRNIRLDEEHHGPAGNRRFTYEPTWVLRGLSSLHIEFDPA